MIGDWGIALGQIISSSEARLASYKKLVQEAYKNQNTELVAIFKEFRIDEEKWLKARREEKTAWNARMWCFGN